jgi:hypothetical protein
MLPVVLGMLCSANGEESTPGHTYALLVSGISKDPNERFVKDRIVNDLRAYLLDKASLDSKRLAVFVPDNSPSPESAGVSSANNLRKAIETFASAISPADRFIFYYIGQANAVTETQNPMSLLRLNLPGPDITPEDLAAWLTAIKAGTQTIILDCPCAAVAAKALAGRGRIILCASNENQAYGTRFGAHFVPALSRAGSDANHDGKVSVLEAFAAAAREIEQWYRERQLLPTETPCLEDDGDGVPSERPWRYEQDGGDGRRAAESFLTATGGNHDG